MLSRLLLATVVLLPLLLHVSGQACCPCTGPISTYCSDQDITCVRGGFDQYQGCSATWTACVPANDWHQSPSSGCACPANYKGSACQFAMPGACNSTAGLIFDGNMLNSAQDVTKKIECQITQDSTSQILDLIDHRVEFTYNGGTGGATLAAFSRIDLGPLANDPSQEQCSNVVQLLTCTMTSCTGEKVLNDPSVTTRYTCSNPKCTACTQYSRCSTVASVASLVNGDVVIEFRNEDPSTGTAQGTAKLSTSMLNLNLDLTCQTGNCASRIDQKLATETKPKLGSKTVIIPIAIALGALCVLCIILTAIARRAGPIRHKRVEVNTGTEAPMESIPVTDPDDESQRTHYGLVWQDVCFTLPRQKRKVLKSVTGCVAPGELVAILGPSGAGKSTLLDLLADRRRGDTEGRMAIVHNGQRVPKASRKDIICYVTQYDDLMNTQTVEETLLFSAALRSRKNQKKSMTRKVSEVLAQLHLSHIAHSRVGNPDIGGISGGERKRVSIGVELVADPGMLVLDEPTSGLDSHSVETLMGVLRSVATQGCAVLFTIHQATPRIFFDFDQVLLMTRLGNIAFFGPPRAALTFMAEAGHEPPSMCSPPDFLMEVVSSRDDSTLTTLAEAYAASSHYQDVKNKVEISLNGNGENSPGEAASLHQFTDRPSRNFLVQMWWLSKRQLRHLARDLTLLVSHIIVTIAMAVFLGLIFWKVDRYIPGIQNRMGLMFFLCIYFSMTSMSSLAVFVGQRQLYWREKAAGYYSSFAYYASLYWCDVFPLRVVPPALFAVISYTMVGLQDGPTQFGVFTLILILVNIVSTSICLTISAGSSSVGQANFVAVIFFIASMIFGGLFLSNDSSSDINRLRLGSFINYAYEALCSNEFTGLSLVFNPKGLGDFGIDGSVILSNFAMQADRLWNTDIPALFTFWACAVVLGYLQLVLYSSPKLRAYSLQHYARKSCIWGMACCVIILLSLVLADLDMRYRKVARLDVGSYVVVALVMGLFFAVYCCLLHRSKKVRDL